MMEQICAYINNHFTHRNGAPIDLRSDTFSIEDGALDLDFAPGTYYLIRDSLFNDGIHRQPAGDLTDETFTGRIYKMAVPPGFIALSEDIAAWVEKYGERADSPYQSENVIGVYSYQLKSTGKTTGEATATWQSTFADRLKPWRKLYDPAR